MMMKPDMIVRFGSGAASILAKNTGNMLRNFFYGSVNNMETFTQNAFILSSLIQVTSRIIVANKTAQVTKNTPEGPYRYMEAVKTTFREALGWGLSYLVLRFFQRASVDFFRNYMMVRKGVSNAPTVLNNLFRWLHKVPADVHPEQAFKINPPFPGLMTTLKGIGKEIGDFVRGKGTLKNFENINLQRFTSLMSEKVKGIEVAYDNRAIDRVRRLMPLVNKINKLAGNDIATMSEGQKLKTFFNWVPPLIGSIPALFLSGFALERFSQNYAEPIAKKIAGYLSKPAPQTKPTVFPRPAQLDPSVAMPYAGYGYAPNARSQAAFSAYGYPVFPRS